MANGIIPMLLIFILCICIGFYILFPQDQVEPMTPAEIQKASEVKAAALVKNKDEAKTQIETTFEEMFPKEDISQHDFINTVIRHLTNEHAGEDESEAELVKIYNSIHLFSDIINELSSSIPNSDPSTATKKAEIFCKDKSNTLQELNELKEQIQTHEDFMDSFEYFLTATDAQEGEQYCEKATSAMAEGFDVLLAVADELL